MAKRRAFLRRLGAAVAASVAVPVRRGAGQEAAEEEATGRLEHAEAEAGRAGTGGGQARPAEAAGTGRPRRPGRLAAGRARRADRPRPGPLDLAALRAHPRQHLRPLPARGRGAGRGGVRPRLGHGRQPLPALRERPPRPVGPRAVRPARLRGRPDRPHAVARPRPERDRGRGPLLRPRRGHVAVREARLPLRAARGRDGRPGDRGGLRRLLARPPRSRAPAGAVQALVPARAAGGLRRAPAARGLERAGRGARRGLDGAAGPGGGGRSPRRRRQPLRVPDRRRRRRGRDGAPRPRGAARPRDVPVRGPPRPLGPGSMAPRPARLVRVPDPGLVRDRGPVGGDALGGGLVGPGAACGRGCFRHLRAAGADGRLPVPDRGGPGRHRGRGDDPGVARPRGPPLARHPPLQLDALRLPRGREPPGELRLRVPALPAGARARGERAGRPARRRRPPAELPLAQGPELRLPGAEAAARLRGLVQHARQRGAGDDRGRHGPRAPAVQRRRGPPPARHPPRVRRPAALAALPPARSRWGRRRTASSSTAGRPSTA